MSTITTRSFGVVIKDEKTGFYLTSRDSWSNDILNAKVFRKDQSLPVMLKGHKAFIIKHETHDIVEVMCPFKPKPGQKLRSALDLLECTEPAKA